MPISSRNYVDISSLEFEDEHLISDSIEKVEWINLKLWGQNL